jgi:hypothetical protein
MISFLKEFAEATDDIREENERQKRNVEAARLQGRRRRKR